MASPPESATTLLKSALEAVRRTSWNSDSDESSDDGPRRRTSSGAESGSRSTSVGGQTPAQGFRQRLQQLISKTSRPAGRTERPAAPELGSSAGGRDSVTSGPNDSYATRNSLDIASAHPSLSERLESAGRAMAARGAAVGSLTLADVMAVPDSVLFSTSRSADGAQATAKSASSSNRVPPDPLDATSGSVGPADLPPRISATESLGTSPKPSTMAMALLRQRALAAGLSASPGDSRRPSSSGNGPSFPALSTSNGPAVPAQAASVTGANDATPFVPTVSPEGPWGLAPVPEMRGGVVSAEAYHPSHGHPAGGLTDWARVGLEPVEPAGPSPVGYVPPGAHARGGVSSGVPVQNGGPRVGSVSPTARGVVSGDGREKGKRGKGPAANGGASGRYIDMLRTLQEARAPAQAPEGTPAGPGGSLFPDAVSGAHVRVWAERLVRRCEREVQALELKLREHRKAWNAQRDEMASELETLRRASLRAEEEVAHAVAEVREEARAEMDAAEERHRKLLERLERHTRQALKARDDAALERLEEARRELEAGVVHYEAVAERTLMAYTRVKDWARRKLILREWLLLANHSRAAKVHESLVQVKDRELKRIKDRLTTELEEAGRRQVQRLVMHTWRLMASGERGRDEVVEHLLRYKRRSHARAVLHAWRELVQEAGSQRAAAEQRAESKAEAGARAAMRAWAAVAARHRAVRRQLAASAAARERRLAATVLAAWTVLTQAGRNAREERAEREARERADGAAGELRRLVAAWREVARGNGARRHRLEMLISRVQLRVQRCAFTAWLEVCRARQTTRWCVETAARGRERRMARSALLSWSALAEDLSRARARADEMRRERDAAALAEAWEGWRGVARGDHIDIDTSSDEAEPGWEGDDDGRGDSSAAESGEEANADASADAGREAKESERTRRVAAHVHALPRRALLRSLCRPASVRFLLASITAAWRLQAAQSRSLRLARETMHTRSPSVEPSSALAKRAQEFQRQGSRVTRSGKYAEAIDAGAVAGQAGGKGARGGGGGAGGGESRPASAGGGAASADRVAKLRREVERVRVEKDHLVALLQALQSSSAQRVAQQQDAIDKRGERIAAMFAAQRGAMKRAQCFRGWAAVAGVGAGAGAGAGDGGAAWRSARRAHRTDDTASSQGGDKPASVAGARAASGAAPHAPHSSSHANTHHANAHAHKPGSAKKSPLGMGGVTGAGYADAGAQHEAWGAGSGAGAGLVAGGGEERWGSPQRQQDGQGPPSPSGPSSSANAVAGTAYDAHGSSVGDAGAAGAGATAQGAQARRGIMFRPFRQFAAGGRPLASQSSIGAKSVVSVGGSAPVDGGLHLGSANGSMQGLGSTAPVGSLGPRVQSAEHSPKAGGPRADGRAWKGAEAPEGYKDRIHLWLDTVDSMSQLQM